MSRTSIELTSGEYLDFTDIRPEVISAYDIAHALGMTCRYGGHVSRFYSVAEHSVLVVRLMRRHQDNLNPHLDLPQDLLLAGLFHDGHEAYIGDIPTPLKGLALGYEELAEQLDEAIAERLGIAARMFHDEAVRRADREALWHEAKLLKPSRGEDDHWPWLPGESYEPLPPQWEPNLTSREATRAFLDMYRYLAPQFFTSAGHYA